LLLAACTSPAYEPLPRAAPESPGIDAGRLDRSIGDLSRAAGARMMGHLPAGQLVFCVPALEVVVATNARWNVSASVADLQERKILDVIIDEMLPLFPVRHPLARRPS